MPSREGTRTWGPRGIRHKQKAETCLRHKDWAPELCLWPNTRDVFWASCLREQLLWCFSRLVRTTFSQRPRQYSQPSPAAVLPKLWSVNVKRSSTESECSWSDEREEEIISIEGDQARCLFFFKIKEDYRPCGREASSYLTNISGLNSPFIQGKHINFNFLQTQDSMNTVWEIWAHIVELYLNLPLVPGPHWSYRAPTSLESPGGTWGQTSQVPSESSTCRLQDGGFQWWVMSSERSLTGYKANT